MQADPLKNLAQRLTGVVHTDPDAIAAASTDFGRVICRRPRAVVWPAHTDDVATVVHHAGEQGWTLTVRGAGHSQGGQALSQAGLVVDTRNLAGIEELNAAEGWVVAGAGARWDTLVKTTMAHRLLPPVLTDNLGVTLGGTLSVGGIGPASFRSGLQAHHCLGVEVVLGSSEVLWLTPEHEPELFQHVLCGLGQYGVITRAKLRLRPFRPYTQIVYLTYQSLAAFLHDALILMRRDHVHLLEGGALPELSGQPRRYLLEAATALEGPAEEAGPQLFQDLSGEAQAIVLNRPTPEYLFRLEQRFARYNRPGEQNCAHPWVEHFLPWAGVTEYVQAATTSFPSTALLLWPMQTDKLPWATFVLPKTAEVMLVGIMANIPQTQLEETLPLLRQVHALGLDLGGKRYLSGWVEFDPAQWREHYGPARWDRIQQLKQRCDPYNIFQPALHSSTGVS